MVRKPPTPEALSAGIEALKEWAKIELHQGTVERKCVLSELSGIPLDEGGEEAEAYDLFEQGLENFDPHDLLGKARGGDPDAHGVLCAIAALCLVDRKEMPEELAFYIGSFLNVQFYTSRSSRNWPPRQRGGDPHAKIVRDRVSFEIVNRLVELGLYRSRGRHRSRNKNRECAYSLTAKILTDAGERTSERAVADAWGKFQKIRHQLKQHSAV